MLKCASGHDMYTKNKYSVEFGLSKVPLLNIPFYTRIVKFIIYKPHKIKILKIFLLQKQIYPNQKVSRSLACMISLQIFQSKKVG